MKKLVFIVLFLLEMTVFSETAKSGVYTNTKDPVSGGNYYIFTTDGEKAVVYEGYVRLDSSADIMPPKVYALYLGVTEGKNGTLVSVKNKKYSFGVISESSNIVKFNVTKKDFREEGSKKTFKYERELTEEDHKKIYTILNYFGIN